MHGPECILALFSYRMPATVPARTGWLDVRPPGRGSGHRRRSGPAENRVGRSGELGREHEERSVGETPKSRPEVAAAGDAARGARANGVTMTKGETDAIALLPNRSIGTLSHRNAIGNGEFNSVSA